MTRTSDGRRAAGHGAAALRTAAFIGIGAALLAGGLLAQPRFVPPQSQPEVPAELFPAFTDEKQAASLAIKTFDEKFAEPRTFTVQKLRGVWVLPNKGGYPIDAYGQLAAATAQFVELRVLDVVSNEPGDHQACGVIEPDAEKIGVEGVGKLVEILDASNQCLVRLIIGHEEKGPGSRPSGGRERRYVREPDRATVYLVEMDAAPLSTSLADWVNPTLLVSVSGDEGAGAGGGDRSANPRPMPITIADVTSVFVADDAVRVVGIDEERNEPVYGRVLGGTFDLAYDGQTFTWSARKLESREANGTPIAAPLAPDEQLATARLDEMLDTLCSLRFIDVKGSANLTPVQCGFWPSPSGDVAAANGELVVGMKDGLEYVLQFGSAATVMEQEDQPAVGAAGAAAVADEFQGHHVLVTTRFNAGLVEKPVLLPVPDMPAAGAGPEDEPRQPEAEPSGGDGAGDAEPAAADAAEQLASADAAEADVQAAVELRRRIEAENQRKQERYEAVVRDGPRRVRRLNARFANWVFVISESDYTKLHLDRAGIVQPRQPEDGGPK